VLQTNNYLMSRMQQKKERRFFLLSVSALFCVLALALAGCGSTTQTSSGNSGIGTVLSVVATEDVWGSIAAQLGGKHVSVISIVHSPDVDPHDYASTSTDARNIATANYVILNGDGYDTWGTKLVDANPAQGRLVLTVSNALGVPSAPNPHFWESPTDVERVADQITANLKSLDPADSAYLTQQRAAFEKALQPYHTLIAEIQTKYANTPVGASELLFGYMAQALKLDLITPPAYLTAENNGTEPPVSAVAEFNQQIAQKQIKVFALDIQNESNETRNLDAQVKAQHIPVVDITETINPSSSPFEAWQTMQLQQLLNALSQAA
jgi:zinc/manganese transport system substrate-binding protein